jgi:hypothetical protein
MKYALNFIRNCLFVLYGNAGLCYLSSMSAGHQVSGVLMKVGFLSIVKQRHLSCRDDLKSDSLRDCSAH